MRGTATVSEPSENERFDRESYAVAPLVQSGRVTVIMSGKPAHPALLKPHC